MGKIRRGNYQFISWIADHGNHIHIYRDKRYVMKWDLDDNAPVDGIPSRKLRKIVNQLIDEKVFYENKQNYNK